MDNKTNGATVERKRERIGLSLAPDVIDILNQRGRGKETACFSCRGTRTKIGGDAHGTAVIVCPMCNGSGIQDDKRPTRTEIIEEAVREWRQARLPKAADLLGSDPDFTGDESTDEYIDRIRGRSTVPSDSQAPERTDDNANSPNNPATAEKKEPQGMVKRSGTKAFRGSFPKPGKK